MNKGIYIVCLIFLLLSCKSQILRSKKDYRIKSGYDYRLQLRNLSDKIIYGNVHFSFPDTSINIYNPIYNSKRLKAERNQRIVFLTPGTWESKFTDLIKSDTIQIFIYDAKTVESTPWDTIRKYNMKLARYAFSYQDLLNYDWTLTYPLVDSCEIDEFFPKELRTTNLRQK